MIATAPEGGPAILICTLGASWAVVPEIFGWLAPKILDLYAEHPDRTRLADERDRYNLPPPDEIWICTTGGEQAAKSVATLLDWWHLLGAAFPLRVWVAEGTADLSSAEECRILREMTLRLVLHASALAGGDGAVVLSLAGGRKTMSADLQDAGHVFGARAWVHIVGQEPMPDALKEGTPAFFTQPLPAEMAGRLQPVVVGRGAAQETLAAPLDGHAVSPDRYPIPLAHPGTPLRWTAPDGRIGLHEELERRLRASSRLLANFLDTFQQRDVYETWSSLLRLPPARLESLRTAVVGETNRSLLAQLPFADLHCHLGGCLDLASQRRVADAIWRSLAPRQRDDGMTAVRPLIDAPGPWPDDWAGRLAGPVRPAASAALLLHLDDGVLAQRLWGETEPRVDLKRRRGFAAYERPGELSGSALLCHSDAIEAYAREIITGARRDGLTYLELRGSPHKYRPTDPASFVSDLAMALTQAGAQTGEFDATRPGPRIGFLWILDRRRPEQWSAIVRSAVAVQDRLPRFMLGLDVAGDESTPHSPADLAASFEPAFEACLRITIHAGEGEAAEHIWQAAYHLHADRIGHGLTLADHPALMQRFRDRGTLLEMCPTSNREVVGFRDPVVPASAAYSPYPLQRFLQAGVPVALCTDNPGISRTSIADEFITASRMIDGLGFWTALALLRQAYEHAFVPANERLALKRHAEHRIFSLLADSSQRLS